MTPVLIATVAGLMTAACWGVSDWLSARSTKKLTPIEVNFAVQAVSLVMVAVLFVFSGLDTLNTSQLARIVIASALITGAFVIFVQALKSGVVGIIVPLSNIYPLFTLILALIFLKVHFSTLHLGAMVGIVLGASLLAYEKNHQRISLKELHRETVLALAAAVIWGVAFFIINPVITEVSWQTIAIVSEVVAFSFALLLITATSRTKTFTAMRKSLLSKTALITGFTGELGLIILFLGASHSRSVLDSNSVVGRIAAGVFIFRLAN